MNAKELKRCKLMERIAERDEFIAKLHESIETSQQSLEKQDVTVVLFFVHVNKNCFFT